MYKFYPILKSVMWGGDRLATFKQLDTTQKFIGESWEISGLSGHESIVSSGKDAGLTLPQLLDKYGAALIGDNAYACYGNEFPLLVKFIDAGKDLSVQVHPDDRLAASRHGCMGKTEMWYVIEAQPDAVIHAGFNHKLTPLQYDRLVSDGEIMQVVKHYPTHSGDAYFLSPGTVHSIGAGNLIAEIQQSSDITYRIYDYDRRDAMGNKRQLHTDLAREAINYDCLDSCALEYNREAVSRPVTIVSFPQFVVSRVVTDGAFLWDVKNVKSFMILMCIAGCALITDDSGLPDNTNGKMTIRQGETLLIPACASCITIDGAATFITAHLP